MPIEDIAAPETEARFRAVNEKSSDVILLTATDGTTIYQSPSAATMLGYSVDEGRLRSFTTAF